MKTYLKKSLSLLLALCMVFSLMSISAFADEEEQEESTPSYVAQVNGQDYASLAGAIAAANDGETVTLLANVTENVIVASALKNKSLTIEGNYTLTSNSGNFGFWFGDCDEGTSNVTDTVNLSGMTTRSDWMQH